MNLFGIVTSAFETGMSLYKMIKGKKDDGTKPSLTELLPSVMATILTQVTNAVSFSELTTKDQILTAVKTLDMRFGSEVGAIDLVNTLPPDQEERLTDAFLVIVEVLACNAAKVPEYYKPE